MSQMWLRTELLWLWCGPVAAAPIQLLAWELPYAKGEVLKSKKKKKKKNYFRTKFPCHNLAGAWFPNNKGNPYTNSYRWHNSLRRLWSST